MFKLGLCSVTFRDRSIDEVISICSGCALEGIEWGGDVHLGAGGRRGQILEVKEKCRAAGLATPGYGSYFDVLEQGPEQFAPVLETAGLIGADTIRVWPGWVRPEHVSDEQYGKIVETSRSIAGQAAKQGIRVAYEFHDNTCTEGGENAMKLLARVNHPNMLTYYQLIRPTETEWNLENLETVYDRLAYIHVQANDDVNNFPLEDFREVWQEIIDRLVRGNYDGWLLFEFNRGNSVGQLRLDLELLRSLIDNADV